MAHWAPRMKASNAPSRFFRKPAELGEKRNATGLMHFPSWRYL